jgi:trans-2,3-dihydro-3-hydroxyanthranilate isomerase
VHRYTVLDVFTDVPLEGHQLAVFLNGTGLSDEVMQRAARELHLSETAFLFPPQGDGHARVRIFTPAAEVPFAGHPVLGTAIFLGQHMATSVVRLETGAGVIPVSLTREEGRVVSGEMEQPIPSVEPFGEEAELLHALGVKRSQLPVEAYRQGPLHVYVKLDSDDAVASLTPDMTALERLGPLGVSCFAVAGNTVKTRMFAPALGVPEDPATGSAAGPLAVHLARHGAIEYGQEIEISQGAEIGRRSRLRARVEGTQDQIERLTVAGSAVVVARGEYRLR